MTRPVDTHGDDEQPERREARDDRRDPQVGPPRGATERARPDEHAHAQQHEQEESAEVVQALLTGLDVGRDTGAARGRRGRTVDPREGTHGHERRGGEQQADTQPRANADRAPERDREGDEAAAEHEHPDHEDPGIAGVPGGQIRDRLVEVAVGRLRPTGDDPGQGEEDLRRDRPRREVPSAHREPAFRRRGRSGLGRRGCRGCRHFVDGLHVCSSIAGVCATRGDHVREVAVLSNRCSIASEAHEPRGEPAWLTPPYAASNTPVRCGVAPPCEPAWLAAS